MSMKAGSPSQSSANRARKQSTQTQIEIELIEHHAGQIALLAGRKRFNAVACGRRWGKTLFATDLVVEGALDGQIWGWFAPSYKILGDAWREARRLLEPIALSVSESDKRIVLLNGGIVEYWSVDNPDAGRSRKYHGIVVDEAGLVANLETIWYNSIRPTLSDFRGQGWLFGTPKGRGFFSTAYGLGQDPENPDWASWQMPTLTNPYIHPDEIADAQRQMPDRSFRQEYLAEFIEEAGGVFRNVTACVDKGRTESEPPASGRAYTLGVDLARVEDFTVLSVVDDTGRQVYHERFNQISWERQTATIERVARVYNASVVLDSTGVGDPIFEACRKNGLSVTPFHFSNQSKESLIDNLAMRLEASTIHLMDIAPQTNELLAYQYELTPSRNVRMNAPSGMHDDCVIGLALSIHLRGPSKTMSVNPLNFLRAGTR
jgi:hypothetical protein